MKREPFDSYIAGLFADKALRSGRARELAEQGKALYSFATPDGGSVAVHASTRKPGTWQVTSFLEDGTPTGHVEAPTRAAALKLAGEFRADLGQPSSTRHARRHARRSSHTSLVVTHEGEPPYRTSLEEFLIDNRDDAATCAAVRALEPGETAVLGRPAVTVKRLRSAGKQRKRGR